MPKRLYLNLYIALLASAFVCLVVAALAFRLLGNSGGPPRERLPRAALVLSERLANARSADAPAVLSELARDFGVEIVVGDGQGPAAGYPSVGAFALPPQPAPGWHRERAGPVLVAALDGGGWGALRMDGPAHRRPRIHPFFAVLGIIAVVMAVGSYPVAKRVTRRLATLARAVEGWGRGDLSVRAPVSGNDEVATLAATFNQAAERLDELLAQQRQMLANASHELRSPLARLRMGLELMGEEGDAARRQQMVQEIHRDIVELDGLIEDLLSMARADPRVPRRAFVPVDVREVLEEEAARTGAAVSVDRNTPLSLEGPRQPAPVRLMGDAVLLRHMVRNLLENAQQYGAGAPVSVRLSTDSTHVRLLVEDQGPGIPEHERERIFAPFYRSATARGKNPIKGHGVGLALVRQVARYHGGEVTYRPGESGGSRFEVSLPVGHAPAPAG